MQMPAPLALELYRTGIIPQGENQRFTLSIDGREEGMFQVIDFRHDNSDGREMVQMTLARVRVSNSELVLSMATKADEI